MPIMLNTDYQVFVIKNVYRLKILDSQFGAKPYAYGIEFLFWISKKQSYIAIDFIEPSAPLN